MPWEPENDFELAIANSQPEYNFIFPALSERKNNYNPFDGGEDYENIFEQENKQRLPKKSQHCSKLAVIDAVNKMSNLKPPGYQASYEDWADPEDYEAIQHESIAMIRHLNLQDSNDDTLESDFSDASDKTTKSLFSQIQWPPNGLFSRNKHKKIGRKKGETIFGSLPDIECESKDNIFTGHTSSFDQNQHKTTYKNQVNCFTAAPQKPSYAEAAGANHKQFGYNKMKNIRTHINSKQGNNTPTNIPQASNNVNNPTNVYMTPKALYKKRRYEPNIQK